MRDVMRVTSARRERGQIDEREPRCHLDPSAVRPEKRDRSARAALDSNAALVRQPVVATA